MERIIDQTEAMRELHESLLRCQHETSVWCDIKPAIDFILVGKNCLTYRYILMTALAAKATMETIDILSLQASDESNGAYDARSFCSHVIYPFQRDFLSNVLDGSNDDPLVNNPGRNARISKSNKVANGDPKKALELLCDYLPEVDTSNKARECLDYLISKCLAIAESRRNKAASFSSAILTSDVFSARRFMDELLDKNFGGAALVLVATAVFKILFTKEQGFRVVPHPVNQSGSSGKQMSDLDIYNKDGSPFLAVELKDRPFTAGEVSKAAETAYQYKSPSLLFIAGRLSTMTDETRRYFNAAKISYEQKGMVVGVIMVDALLDYFLTTHYNMDSTVIFELMDNTMLEVKASPEVMSWVYQGGESLQHKIS